MGLGGIVQERIVTMNGYDLEGLFLDYVFQKVIGIMCELQVYIPSGQDISMVNHDYLLGFIENIKKELTAMGRSLPFMTSESAHGIVEKLLGGDEAFHFAVECSLATVQLTHFSCEPSNEEEEVTPIQQAIAALHEMARQEPYIPFKEKCIVEDDRPSCIHEERVL